MADEPRYDNLPEWGRYALVYRPPAGDPNPDVWRMYDEPDTAGHVEALIEQFKLDGWGEDVPEFVIVDVSGTASQVYGD